MRRRMGLLAAAAGVLLGVGLLLANAAAMWGMQTPLLGGLLLVGWGLASMTAKRSPRR